MEVGADGEGRQLHDLSADAVHATEAPAARQSQAMAAHIFLCVQRDHRRLDQAVGLLECGVLEEVLGFEEQDIEQMVGRMRSLVIVGLTSQDITLSWMVRRVLPLQNRGTSCASCLDRWTPRRTSRITATLAGLQDWISMIFKDEVFFAYG